MQIEQFKHKKKNSLPGSLNGDKIKSTSTTLLVLLRALIICSDMARTAAISSDILPVSSMTKIKVTSPLILKKSSNTVLPTFFPISFKNVRAPRCKMSTVRFATDPCSWAKNNPCDVRALRTFAFVFWSFAAFLMKFCSLLIAPDLTLLRRRAA